jgi:hypothetical protein
MSHLLLKLGAIDKENKIFVIPINASKKKEYICPECNSDVILKHGEIRRTHFSHKPDSNCNYYKGESKGGESSIHKNSKYIMKDLLETDIPIYMFKKCNGCSFIKKIEILKNGFKQYIEIEHRFLYNEAIKIADICQLKINREIINIFEIYYSHKTKDEDRPEPFYEIDALILTNLYNIYCKQKDSFTYFNIPCIREFYCDNCIKIEKGVYKIPSSIEQFFYISDINSHIKYLKEYEEKYGDLDIEYEWLKNHIEKNIEIDYMTNKFLFDNLNSWVMYLIEYIEHKLSSSTKDVKYTQEQIDIIVNTVSYIKNFCCQGPAGTGKSITINGIEYLAYLIGRNVHKIAPTGMAANNIGGTTLTSFLISLKLGKKLDYDDMVIIDEMSMVSDKHINNLIGEIGDKIQIIYFGDFSQFPPVKAKSCVYSSLWKIDDHFQLTENMRQRDKPFGDFLLKFRLGNITNTSIIDSRTNIGIGSDTKIQHVFYRNKDVNNFNDKCLKELGNKIYNFDPIVQTFYSYETTREDEKKIYKLNLSIDAKIIITKNFKAEIINDDNEIQGEKVKLVNGTKGNVKEINDEYIIIETDDEVIREQYSDDVQCIINKRILYVKKEKDEDNDKEDDEDDEEEEINNKILFKVINYPLILGYSSTLHKAQGQTCSIVIHLMGLNTEYELSFLYVAFTRAPKLNELYIVTEDGKNIDFKKIKSNPETNKLINGFIYSCKNCYILMNNNKKFCDTCEIKEYKYNNSKISKSISNDNTKMNNIKNKYYINNGYIEGDTFTVRDKLKTYGCKYDGNKKKWKIPINKNKVEELETYLKSL